MAADGRREHAPGLYSRLSVPGAAVTHHQRWASVDALRAVAALMVLASHTPGLGLSTHYSGLTKQLPRLGVGVWIFFAASGYLIAGPFLSALNEGRPLPPVLRYARRRAVRILPAYWVALAAILLVANGSALVHWWQLPVHALLVHGFVPGELWNIFLVAWSLAVEAIFYVLVPLCAWAVRRRYGNAPIPLGRLAQGVLGLWCAAVAFTLLIAVAFPIKAGHPLPGGVQVLDLVGNLANFCPGMLVFIALAAREGGDFRWERRYTAVASRPLPTLIVAASLFIVATELPFATSHLAAAAQGPLMGVAAGLVLSTFVNGGGWTQPLSRALAPIGLISYGVYLWHWVILSALQHHGVTIGFGNGTVAAIVRLSVLTALTLPVALLSWLLVERPLLRRTAGWERRSAERTAKQRHDEGLAARALGGSAPAPVPAPPRP
jgi:peptidoglycan/LPS O-acetylase OafA/YrhL